jgi:hypothetical protein
LNQEIEIKHLEASDWKNQKRRWMDNIKMYLIFMIGGYGLYRDSWRALVITVMKLRVP